jgi:uncharacterized membrane protein YhaH (DUF805 family)
LSVRSEQARFLYRTETGEIDRNTWVGGALPLLIVFSVLTAVMREAIAFSNRPLSERAFLDGTTLAANVYMIFYALAVILLGVCWVNLTAKRLRARGWGAPVLLAGVAPFLLFVAGAAHWLQPRVAEVMPRLYVQGADLVFALALVWTLVETLDLLKTRNRA